MRKALKRLNEFWETDVPAHAPVLLVKMRKYARDRGIAAAGVLVVVANLEASVIATQCLAGDEIASTLHDCFGYPERSREAVVFKTLVDQASLTDGHLAVCALCPLLGDRFPPHMAILVPDEAKATPEDVEAHRDIELDGDASALVLRAAAGKPTLRVCQNAACPLLEVRRPDIDQAALMLQTAECAQCKLVCCGACAEQHSHLA
jgi:hypothetical protein